MSSYSYNREIKMVSIVDIINCLGHQLISVYGRYDDVYIDNLADVAHVNASTLDWVNPDKWNKQEVAQNSSAHVILVDESIEPIPEKVMLYVKNPKISLAIVGNTFFVKRPKPGIHPTAIVDEDAMISNTATIGAYAIIGKVMIGANTVISPYVRIYDNVVIGSDCFVKEGAVIGGMGFGFERDEGGNLFRFPQIGGVKIGNHVDIGGNTCIDCGALSDTVLEDYVKVDNLCHIAHNVHIGSNTVVVACAEVSGSCQVGNNSWIGPNASLRDQRNVGTNTLIGMGAVVVKNIGDNEVWAGNPAKLFEDK